jgi:hypothetical protein
LFSTAEVKKEFLKKNRQEDAGNGKGTMTLNFKPDKNLHKYILFESGTF